MFNFFRLHFFEFCTFSEYPCVVALNYSAYCKCVMEEVQKMTTYFLERTQKMHFKHHWEFRIVNLSICFIQLLGIQICTQLDCNSFQKIVFILRARLSRGLMLKYICFYLHQSCQFSKISKQPQYYSLSDTFKLPI